MNLKSIFIGCFILFMSCYANSSTSLVLNVNKEIEVDNAVVLGNGIYSPNQWTPISNLTPTKKFIPSSLLSNSPDKLSLTNEKGDTISVSIKAIGMSYNLSGNKATKEANTYISPTCSTSEMTSNMVHLFDEQQTNCSSDFAISFDKEVSPFYFYRPILSIDNNNLLSALDGKSSGRYVGVLSGGFKYYYLSFGGALTYRIVPESIVVTINYEPNYLTNVDVIGDGVMQPVYSGTSVSSHTQYSINASGNFKHGLAMVLSEQDYSLFSESGESKIPFSITCNNANCINNEWVKNGELKLENGYTEYLSPSNANNINFNIDLNYDDIKSSQVESANYSTSFTVMFEAIL
ncbi:hypothetical protein [Aliivibrio sifiae]|uniref:hypothetical protein n=1 Tax=Aliivibrio sifiae TaxID=566293 RepID=UPI003D15102A